MIEQRREALMKRLAKDVADYHIPDVFVLLDDLARLEAVQHIGAPEATVFYCGRILEVLAGRALDKVGLEAGSTVFSNLETLQQFNLMSEKTSYCAHALRRSGNSVRHVQRRVGQVDADWAVAFVERWLHWFFCQFRYGPPLDQLTQEIKERAVQVHERIVPLMSPFDTTEFHPVPFLQKMLTEHATVFFENSALPAVLVQMLLERKELEAAHELIQKGLARFPDDLRLLQLQGLYWSRKGELNRASALLKELHSKNRNDEETTGIFAGMCKRRWLADRKNENALEEARRLYRHGWAKSSGRNNAYLGVNAAATTLWLNRPVEARELADEVATLLNQRAAALARHTADPDLASNFWEQVTHAEVALLQDNSADARRRYLEAFAAHPEQKGSIEVAMKQLDLTLPLLGVSPNAATWLGRVVVVGVTGHRRLPEDARFGECLRKSLETIGQTKKLIALSPLAEGADRLVANTILDAPFHGSLRVVLPLEVDDYCTDFGSEGSREEFRRLLARAESVIPTPTPAEQKDRTAAYERVGRYVVDHCDVLVALWDGQPAKGRGGTAEIVAYARKAGRPIIWIHTEAPYHTSGENGVDIA